MTSGSAGESVAGRSGLNSAGSVTRQWIPLWKEGNREALGELCLRFQSHIWGLARVRLQRLGLSDRFTSADDVAQETFLKLYPKDAASLSQVCDSESFISYLARVICGHCVDQRRRASADKRGGGRVVGESELSDDGSRSPLDGPARENGWEDVVRDECRELFDAITDPEQRVLLGLKLEGLTNQEMADALGVSQATVKRRISVLMSWLQSKVDDVSMK